MVALMPPPAGSSETYPFFNWSLFSHSSDSVTDALAIIHSIDGKPLAEPVSFYDLPEEFAAAGARDARFMKLVDKLAHAINTKDDAQIQSSRDLIEQHFMREASSVEYEIAIARFHPFERYKEGKLRSVEVLGRYSKK